MFTSQIAHPISKKIFKKWNKPGRTRGVKVKTSSTNNIFQLGSRASLEFPPPSSPRHPPARDFILTPTAASRMHSPAVVRQRPATSPAEAHPPAREFVLARQRPAEVPPPAREFVLARQHPPPAPAAVRQHPLPAPAAVHQRPPPAPAAVHQRPPPAPAAVRQRPVASPTEVPLDVNNSFTSYQHSSSPAVIISSISTVSDLSSTPNSPPLELPMESPITSSSLQDIGLNIGQLTSSTVFDLINYNDLGDSNVIASDMSSERNTIHRVTSRSPETNNPRSFTTSVNLLQHMKNLSTL
ncbi:hypothetical protein F4604DRAFT_1681470 [Suillus subluteus]|nr:hypothetical protein F4604DRAFT_1681470 [Suillus subluteus]